MSTSTINLSSSTTITSKTGFASEADLIELVLQNLSEFLPNTKYFAAFKEVKIGEGIVDIILSNSRSQQLKTVMQRLTSQVLATYQVKGVEAVALSHLYLNRPLKIETISRRSGLDAKELYTSLTKLTELGFCRQPNSKTYVRTPITDHFSSLVAIEGKLRDWNKALFQANRNRLFSKYSYVVIDVKYAKPAIKNIESFRRVGVGLAVASRDTASIEIVLPPDNSGPISDMFFFLAREVLMGKIAEYLSNTIPLDEAIFSQDFRDALYHAESGTGYFQESQPEYHQTHRLRWI